MVVSFGRSKAGRRRDPAAAPVRSSRSWAGVTEPLEERRVPSLVALLPALASAARVGPAVAEVLSLADRVPVEGVDLSATLALDGGTLELGAALSTAPGLSQGISLALGEGVSAAVMTQADLSAPVLPVSSLGLSTVLKLSADVGASSLWAGVLGGGASLNLSSTTSLGLAAGGGSGGFVLGADVGSSLSLGASTSGTPDSSGASAGPGLSDGVGTAVGTPGVEIGLGGSLGLAPPGGLGGDGQGSTTPGSGPIPPLEPPSSGGTGAGQTTGTRGGQGTVPGPDAGSGLGGLGGLGGPSAGSSTPVLNGPAQKGGSTAWRPGANQAPAIADRSVRGSGPVGDHGEPVSDAAGEPESPGTTVEHASSFAEAWELGDGSTLPGEAGQGAKRLSGGPDVPDASSADRPAGETDEAPSPAAGEALAASELILDGAERRVAGLLPTADEPPWELGLMDLESLERGLGLFFDRLEGMGEEMAGWLIQADLLASLLSAGLVTLACEVIRRRWRRRASEGAPAGLLRMAVLPGPLYLARV